MELPPKLEENVNECRGKNLNGSWVSLNGEFAYVSNNGTVFKYRDSLSIEATLQTIGTGCELTLSIIIDDGDVELFNKTLLGTALGDSDPKYPGLIIAEEVIQDQEHLWEGRGRMFGYIEEEVYLQLTYTGRVDGGTIVAFSTLMYRASQEEISTPPVLCPDISGVWSSEEYSALFINEEAEKSKIEGLNMTLTIFQNECAFYGINSWTTAYYSDRNIGDQEYVAGIIHKVPGGYEYTLMEFPPTSPAPQATTAIVRGELSDGVLTFEYAGHNPYTERSGVFSTSITLSGGAPKMNQCEGIKLEGKFMSDTFSESILSTDAEANIVEDSSLVVDFYEQDGCTALAKVYSSKDSFLSWDSSMDKEYQHLVLTMHNDNSTFSALLLKGNQVSPDVISGHLDGDELNIALTGHLVDGSAVVYSSILERIDD